MEKKQLKLLLNKAQTYCSLSERSPLEVSRKLSVWSDGDIDDEEKGEILNKLKADQYLDIDRYVSAFVSDKMRLNHDGPLKIRYALRDKGIEDTDIDTILYEIEDDEWISILIPLIEKKNRSIRTPNTFERRSKLFRYGSGKGFLYEHIQEALRHLDIDSDEDDVD